MRPRLAVLSLLLVAGCPKPEGSPARPGPAAADAALCGQLQVLADAAAGNFAAPRGERALQRDGQDGVAATLTIGGTQACAILRADPAYPNDMFECELGAAGGADQARTTIATWVPRIAACPVVATWVSEPHADGTHAWAIETGDDHLLTIQLDVAGEAPARRPVLRVRRPEI